MARICNDAWRTKARFHVAGLAERSTRLNPGLNAGPIREANLEANLEANQEFNQELKQELKQEFSPERP